MKIYKYSRSIVFKLGRYEIVIDWSKPNYLDSAILKIQLSK